MNEIWQSKRCIPIHTLTILFREIKLKALLKAHVLTGCDIPSKLKSKLSAIKNKPENFFLHCRIFTLGNDAFPKAEKYLVSCRIISKVF